MAIGLARWREGDAFDFTISANMAGFLNKEMRKAVHASPDDPGAALDELMLVQMKRNTADMMWAEIDPERQVLLEGMKAYQAAP